MVLIFSIALVLVFLTACFAGLFWSLASRLHAGQRTVDWLDSFSLESYAPMRRVLEKRDIEFLESQPGYRGEIGKRLMAERRKIFAAYLGNLIRDFNQLVGIGKLMIVYSSQDRQEFARLLWRQQMRFYSRVCMIRVQLALLPLGWTVLGWTEIDAHPLVAALTAMRDQVLLVTSTSQTLETT